MNRLRSSILLTLSTFTSSLTVATLVICITLAGCGGGGGNSGGGGTQPPPPTITSVSVTCAAATVPTGKTTQCTPTVAGTGSYSPAVTWAVNGASGGNSIVGTVSSAGLYTAPNSVPTPYTISVTVTSTVDATKSASFSVIVAGTIASVTEPVSSSLGGTLALPDGSSVTIAAGALPTDQSVTLSEVSYLQQQPPNKSIAAVGPGLVLTFATPIPSAAQSGSKPQSLKLTLNASAGAQPSFAFSINAATNKVSGLSGSVSIVDFLDSSGSNTFMGGAGNYDSTAAVVTDNVGTDQWQSILSVATNSIQSVIASAGNIITSLAGDVYNVFTAPHSLSLSIASSSSQDSWGNYTTCPTGKTLLVVHGMNDYIEQGFSTGTNGNPPIIQAIVAAGNYQNVVGFDYDWTQRINTSGGQLATFLNTVTACSNVSLDIEAHSEGVAVSLSAISQMNSSQRATIKHLVGLGGPIMGTPIANDSRALGTILMAMSALNIADNIVIDGLADLLTKPFVSDLQTSMPGSGDTLDQIRTSLSTASANNEPQIIAVAGNSAQAASGVLGKALRVCGALLQAQGATYSDGFIPVTSALAFQPGVQPDGLLKVYALEPFPTDHLDLVKCGDGAPNDPCANIRRVVSAVGSDVSNAFVPPTLGILNTLQCSDSTNNSSDLVCSSSPGSIFLLNGSGYSTDAQNSGWELDATGNVTNASGFMSSDGTIPQDSWIEQTTCPSPAATLMFFAQNATTQQPSNAVSAEIVAGSCTTPSITVSPSSATVAVTQSQQFSAVAIDISSSVVWSVNGNPGGNSAIGTVSPIGLYTAPSAVPSPSTATISATSQVDSNIGGSATITIAAVGAVIVNPSSVTVPAGSTQTFSAAVVGGGAVTWGVKEGSAGGGVTNAGIYTAPTLAGTYHVVATNAANAFESAIATVNVVAGPSIKTLHSFNHTTEGAIPWSAPIFGSDGNLYGVTQAGGDLSCAYQTSFAGCGTIYKSDTSGNLATLYSFSGPDGAYPVASLTQGSSGSFYGTTSFGGTNTSECVVNGTSTSAGCGALFSLTLPSSFALLYSFGPFYSPMAVSPQAPLIQTNSGLWYGSTIVGGNSSCSGRIGTSSNTGCGSIFTYSSANGTSALHTFSGSDGAYPEGALLQQKDGNFYGITSGGGLLTCSSYDSLGCGTVFQMTSAGAIKTLHSFSTTDGAHPYQAMILGSDGWMYGVTVFGGSTTCSGGAQWQGCGTVFKIDTAGNFTTLHSFSGSDGAYPTAIMQAGDGSFYGTTQGGGDASCSGRYGPGCGTVFKMDSAGNVTVLYSFTGQSDGSWPESGVVQGSDGNLYGTTAYGGANDDGVIFRISNLTTLAAAKAQFGAPEVTKEPITPLLMKRPHVGPPGPPAPAQQ